ncbi:hypothetical protein AB7M37_002825 [Sinorhizobium fredii]
MRAFASQGPKCAALSLEPCRWRIGLVEIPKYRCNNNRGFLIRKGPLQVLGSELPSSFDCVGYSRR